MDREGGEGEREKENGRGRGRQIARWIERDRE